MITDLFWLDWALISASLFNAIVLLWLALTVFLNAERRTWGVWLIEEGLALGALFFISHTAILGQELTAAGSPGVNFWWRTGWLPVIVSPYAWYIVILWYTGYWDSKTSPLYRRHHPWFVLTSAGASGLAVLIASRHALPTYAEVTNLDLSATFEIYHVPVLFIVWPIFMVLCMVLSIDALRRPAPAGRMMGDLARQRSRPWLTATAVMFLLASVLVAAFLVWIVRETKSGAIQLIDMRLVRGVALFDLMLSLLIGCAIILLGQAVVSYEVFTGKVLPRRGFFRHWRNAILLAAGYALVIGGSLVGGLRSIYSLILTAVLMVVFYALLSWRSFVERDQFIKRLRPFVSSQQLTQHLMNTTENTALRSQALFQSVCQEVLGTQSAQLIPLGILAPLVGAPLNYPALVAKSNFRLPATLFPSSDTVIVPLDPQEYDGLQWAIPLWAERGLIGALLLGGKQDGGLYTQEEIEIARAGGERIIDMLAGEQMVLRLMEFQRQKMFENRVLDLRTRRVLHDEVLPTLHTAILALSTLNREQPNVAEAIKTLAGVHHQIADLIHTLPGTPSVVMNGKGLTETLRALVHEEFEREFTTILWNVETEIPPLDPLAHEIVYGAVREVIHNAAAHGRGADAQRKVSLTIVVQCKDWVEITVTDDGVGLLYQAQPRSNGAELPRAGSGGGLALHSTMMAIIGGYVKVEAAAAGGTQVVITFPTNELNLHQS